MTKRLIDIDDELLAQAREAIGEATMKDTVAAALALAVQIKAGHDSLAILRDADATDIGLPAVMNGAWR